MGPCDLDELMKLVPAGTHPDLLMGVADSGDVGIFRVSDDTAIVQSVDFFPPMVTDPRAFGRITAANALSDIYTTGARPVTALNLLSAPKDVDKELLAEILTGGHEIVTEAGAVILGGHTIRDDSIKYGLAVTGLVHPDKIVRHDTPKAGDVLVLTKPVGTGILVSAMGRSLVDESTWHKCIDTMIALNRIAGDSLDELNASAATDVTGFGLVGHALQMLTTGDVGYRIKYPDIPLLPGVEDFVDSGYFPGGTKRNMEHFASRVDGESITNTQMVILNDAQTSGGLLIALSPESAATLVQRIGKNAAVIGEVVAEHPGRIGVIP